MLSCFMKELVSCLTAKPVCIADKVALFALSYAKINVGTNYFFTSLRSTLNKGDSEGVWKYRWLQSSSFHSQLIYKRL